MDVPLGVIAQLALHKKRPRSTLVDIKSWHPPWSCTKTALIQLVDEMHDLAEQTELSKSIASGTGRRSKVHILAKLLTVLESHLPPEGSIAAEDIQALKVRSGVGPWTLTQLGELQEKGSCSYLIALHQRAGIGSKKRCEEACAYLCVLVQCWYLVEQACLWALLGWYPALLRSFGVICMEY